MQNLASFLLAQPQFEQTLAPQAMQNRSASPRLLPHWLQVFVAAGGAAGAACAGATGAAGGAAGAACTGATGATGGAAGAACTGAEWEPAV